MKYVTIEIVFCELIHLHLISISFFFNCVIYCILFELILLHQKGTNIFSKCILWLIYILISKQEYVEKIHKDDNYVTAVYCAHYSLTDPEGEQFGAIGTYNRWLCFLAKH